MIEQHKQLLKNSLEDSQKIRDSFFNFQVETMVNLQTSQLNFFQSVSAVSLAVLALSIGIGKLEFNIWNSLSLFLSLVLLVYTSSLSRETIDSEANSLEETEEFIKSQHEKIEEKVTESFKKDDVNIFLNFVKESIKKEPLKNKTLLYTGEMVLFLFYSLVLITIFSFFRSQFNIQYLILILFFSYTIAFSNWSLFLTRSLSSLLIKRRIK